jgi:hypothetical protein
MLRKLGMPALLVVALAAATVAVVRCGAGEEASFARAVAAAASRLPAAG